MFKRNCCSFRFGLLVSIITLQIAISKCQNTPLPPTSGKTEAKSGLFTTTPTTTTPTTTTPTTTTPTTTTPTTTTPTTTTPTTTTPTTTTIAGDYFSHFYYHYVLPILSIQSL